MPIDRLLIYISVAELIYLACADGVTCYSIFQWLTILLILTKGSTWVTTRTVALIKRIPRLF